MQVVNELCEGVNENPWVGAPSFGYFGNAGRGFDHFVRLADDINHDRQGVKFELVGHLKYPGKYSSYAGPVTGLVASASFLDSISFIKPGIFLKNPYIDFYFERIGDIGYLCDTPDEMRALILSLVREFPAERYRQQQVNILHGRQIFEPPRVADQFRKITIELGL